MAVTWYEKNVHFFADIKFAAKIYTKLSSHVI